ncbi:MAG: tRNA1(Val) (adenine(37)-N6)-methyltransferase [Hyphomicrobiaceae bacterium]
MTDDDGKAAGPLSDDAFLGDALNILQPAYGYRAGIDAVLLAAAAPVRTGRREHVLDAGAGVGVVGLCVAARFPDARVTLVEVESSLAEIAAENVQRNGLKDRVAVAVGDLTAQPARLDLQPESFAHVLANPPFAIEGRSRPAGSRLKTRAVAMARNSLDDWGRFLARMAAPHASATVIHRADALYDLLAMFDGRFGSLRILPLHPRAGTPAIRILVQGFKGSRAPATLLPGLILHGDGNAFLPDIQAVLRAGAALKW